MVASVNNYKISNNAGIEYNSFNEILINDIAFISHNVMQYNAYFNGVENDVYYSDILPFLVKYSKLNCFISITKYLPVIDYSDEYFITEDDDDFNINNHIEDHHEIHIIFRTKEEGIKLFEYIINTVIPKYIDIIDFTKTVPSIRNFQNIDFGEYVAYTFLLNGLNRFSELKFIQDSVTFDLTKIITEQFLTVDLLGEVGKYILDNTTLKEKMVDVFN